MQRLVRTYLSVCFHLPSMCLRVLPFSVLACTCNWLPVIAILTSASHYSPWHRLRIISTSASNLSWHRLRIHCDIGFALFKKLNIGFALSGTRFDIGFAEEFFLASASRLFSHRVRIRLDIGFALSWHRLRVIFDIGFAWTLTTLWTQTTLTLQNSQTQPTLTPAELLSR